MKNKIPQRNNYGTKKICHGFGLAPLAEYLHLVPVGHWGSMSVYRNCLYFSLASVAPNYSVPSRTSY